MSRMIFALCAISVVSGCHLQTIHRPISLVGARVETLVSPCRSRGCDDCTPRRPFTCDYYPWWDYHVTEYTAQKCAFRAYREYKQTCGRPASHHFKCGFIAAYEDLALNRQPVPPIVPPPKYWNAYYRSCAGEQYVDDWFAGYDAGLEMGLNSGVSRFRTLYIRDGYECAEDGANEGHTLAGGDYDLNQPVVPAIPSATPTTAILRTEQNAYGVQSIN